MSSQLGFIRKLEVAVVWRCNELKSCVVPVVVAQRPAVGETHPRDEPPPTAASDATCSYSTRGDIGSTAARHSDAYRWRIVC